MFIVLLEHLLNGFSPFCGIFPFFILWFNKIMVPRLLYCVVPLNREPKHFEAPLLIVETRAYSNFSLFLLDTVLVYLIDK